jgi:hypothetical protein
MVQFRNKVDISSAARLVPQIKKCARDSISWTTSRLFLYAFAR